MVLDDQANQALDDLLKCLEQWHFAYSHTDGIEFKDQRIRLINAFREWKKASEPPGDPHKEWVDAERLKPSSRLRVLVLDKYAGLAIGLWDNRIKQWEVQPFRLAWHRADKQVTHWRHMPAYDMNWNVPLGESEEVEDLPLDKE